MATSLRLLILEDDPSDAELEVAILQQAGYICEWERVESEPEFLDCLDSSEYDLILADYNLPAFDGLAALEIFHQQGLDLPFILVSGSVGEEIAIESLKSGATDYVLKERLSRLGPVVRRALAEKEEKQQRRTAEQALYHSEVKYRQLFNSIVDPIFVFDQETLLFVDCNRSAVERYGYSLEELRGMTPAQLHPPEENEGLELIPPGRDGDSAAPQDYVSVTRDGERLYVEARTTPLEYQGRPAWISIVRDITQRRQAEETLLRRNRELNLLNQASQALSSTLDLDEVLVTVLGEVRRLLGGVASSVWLIHPETEELICREAAGPQSETVRGWRLGPGEGLSGWVVETGKPLIVADTWEDDRYFAGVEEEIKLSLRSVLAVPMRVKQEVIGVLQVVGSEPNAFQSTDLPMVESLAATAAIAAENARLFSLEVQRAVLLARTLEKQRELDRLKNEFIQNVSHELRTPLAITLGYAELLESGELGELHPEQRSPVTIIARRMRMLRKLVDDINAILEIETQGIRHEPIDIADLVKERLDDFQAVIDEHGLVLDAEIAPGQYRILGDDMQLSRMLDNLLGNALKFTPQGGQVTVRLQQDQEKIILEVSDTGIGMPSSELRRIFERFYQVDGSTTRRFGGAGLGLALVKDIIDAHGGTVTVRSQLNAGSTFRIVLPLER